MEANSLVPKLRFKQDDGKNYPNWEKKKLGDVGKVKMCKRVFSNQTTLEGSIPFYKIGTFGKEADAFIGRDLYNDLKLKFSYPKVGEILISASGTLGRTVVFDGTPSYYQDSNIVWLENNEELITNNFLYYIYQIVRFDSEGGTIQRLYNNIILSTKFYKPSLTEQNKIASFLTSEDNKINLLTKKKALLETYKKGVMQKIFSQEIRFKDEEGNDFPDWEEKQLGEILSIASGRDYKNLGKGDIPVYGTGGLMTRVDKYLYEGDSVGIGRKGTIDKPVMLRGKFWTVDTLFYTHNFINSTPKFVFYLFQRIAWYRYNEASGVPSLSKKTIEKILKPFPSYREQYKIADFLSSIDKKIEQVDFQLDRNKEFKKGLLQQMFV